MSIDIKGIRLQFCVVVVTEGFIYGFVDSWFGGVVNETRVLRHSVENGVFVGQQNRGRIVLRDFPLVENNHAVAVHDGVQSVRNGQDGAVGEFRPDCVLVINSL